MKNFIQLLKKFDLPDFPSGSSINFYDNQLFLIGDDANSIWILDTEYRKINTLRLFGHEEKRIPKKEKVDLEASTFVAINGVEYLLIMGSGSKRLRKKLYIIPYEEQRLNLNQSSAQDTDVFIDRIKQFGINEINFEGITTVSENNKILIGNRGNRESITNHLICTDAQFWNIQSNAMIHVMPLQLPLISGASLGISELYYETPLDLLLVTFSSEDTSNTYDDGTIGDSYIGIIMNFEGKMLDKILMIDEMICLAEVHPDFKGEKIEGICIETIQGDTLIVHLISDNDMGESKLFKVKMTIPMQGRG